MERVPQESYDSSLPYVCFRGGYLSNWHICHFEVDSQAYNCTEQYMMAEKAKLFEDWVTRQQILEAKNPR